MQMFSSGGKIREIGSLTFCSWSKLEHTKSSSKRYSYQQLFLKVHKLPATYPHGNGVLIKLMVCNYPIVFTQVIYTRYLEI